MNVTDVITVTPAAQDYLSQLVAKKSAHGFYLKIKNSGCSGLRYNPEIVMSPPAEALSGDFAGLTIYIDDNAVEILQDTVIDCKDLVLKQKQIIYKNPNAEDVCGCGESFNIKDKK
jgi:iron-sulfur cluster assembly accessory protein